MKKIGLIVVIVLGLALVGCKKELTPIPIGSILIEKRHSIIEIKYSKFDKNSDSYRNCEKTYLENKGYWEYEWFKSFDNSEIKDIPAKTLTIMDRDRKLLLCSATKETDKAYYIENDIESYVTKIPYPKWFGLGYVLWEDGERVKEGKLCGK